MQPQRLLASKMALVFELFGFLLDLFAVSAVLLDVFCVSLGFLGFHGGEEIARDFRFVAADGLGLVVRPLIGSLLLVDEFFGGVYVAEGGDDGQQRGDHGHGGGHFLVKGRSGVLSVFSQLFFCAHVVKLTRLWGGPPGPRGLPWARCWGTKQR